MSPQIWQQLRSFQSASDGLTVSVEHFLGLVSLSACDAASIFAALKAFLAYSDIDAGKLRGQGMTGLLPSQTQKWSSNVYPHIGTTSIVCAL